MFFSYHSSPSFHGKALRYSLPCSLAQYKALSALPYQVLPFRRIVLKVAAPTLTVTLTVFFASFIFARRGLPAWLCAWISSLELRGRRREV